MLGAHREMAFDEPLERELDRLEARAAGQASAPGGG